MIYIYNVNLFKKIRIVLNKPFPIRDGRSSYFSTVFLIGLFVAMFLYIFRPFGISLMESRVLTICSGYGGITIASILLYDLFLMFAFKDIRRRDDFNFGKWILYMIGLLSLIGFANFNFSKAVLGYFEWGELPRMMIATVAVGIFPTVVIGGFTLLRAERKYQQISNEINEDIGHETNIGEEKRSIFNIDSSAIRYVEALQNYVRIGYVKKSGEFNEQIERTTLKTVLEKLQGGSIIKCHRSFLVNTNWIKSTSGNAQGLILTLEDCEKKIPVSRTYVSKFRN